MHIGGRALDILIFLAERAGQVVNKNDLFAHVWSDVTVDESSLRFHVASLRKALGDAVVDHYVHTAKWEQFEYDRRITDWELMRGFERY